MKPIILIKSCNLYRGRIHDAVRDTWLRSWCSLCDYRFVVGRGSDPATLASDEIAFDVEDGYLHIGKKTQAAQRWAIAHGYDYTFQCCADTYVNVRRLLRTGFQDRDYMGVLMGVPPFCHGGFGYWLSPRAGAVVAATEYSPAYEDTFSEDGVTGIALRAHGITPVSWGQSQFSSGVSNTLLFDRFLGVVTPDNVTKHLSNRCVEFNPQWIYDAHKGMAEAAIIEEDCYKLAARMMA